jgi:hypothetical protein
MKFSAGIQKFLSFGYLFLVVLGILKESLFYYPLGIHILNYSTIMDVLLSPVADLTSHPVVFIAVAILVLFSYFFPVFLARNKHRAIARKMAGLEGKEHRPKARSQTKFPLFLPGYWRPLCSLFLSAWAMAVAGSRRSASKKVRPSMIVP